MDSELTALRLFPIRADRIIAKPISIHHLIGLLKYLAGGSIGVVGNKVVPLRIPAARQCSKTVTVHPLQISGYSKGHGELR
jgi:hypothetical protein